VKRRGPELEEQIANSSPGHEQATGQDRAGDLTPKDNAFASTFVGAGCTS
jgi:hypothetical protein